MKNMKKLVPIFMIVYALLGMAFFLFIFSYAPFIGVTVTNFWYSLLFTTIVSLITVPSIIVINESKRIKNSFIKILIYFVIAFLVMHITALVMGSVSIVLWLKIVLSLQVALAFLKN